MIAEPTATALFLLLFGVLVGVSVLFSRTMERLGVPVVLLFLVLGMLAGSQGIGGIQFDNYHFAFRLGTLALALILFDGGLNTSASAVRAVWAPASVLATVGVAGTAGLVAVFAHFVGFGWPQALLLGAVVSSTDAAAVFAVLRGGGVHLKRRVGATLELESGINDPMAVILTATLTQVLLGQSPSLAWTLLSIPLQLVIGGVAGVAFGLLGRAILRNLRLSTGGLYPALTLALAFVAFGGATLVNGSGFLAVYVAGYIIGNAEIPYQGGLRRVHDSLAWLSQISMFLMLGLLVFPTRLLDVAWEGLAIALFLAFIARPVVVGLCLLPFRFPSKELGYVCWVGLRGAVPIILGTFPVLAGVPDAERVFTLVFFIVVVGAIVPGATIRTLARRLGLERHEAPAPSAVLEINSMQTLRGDVMSFYIDSALAVCGASLAQVPFPPESAAILIVRGDELMACRGNTTLQPGDHVYVFCRPEDRPYIELLFGRPLGGAAAPS